VSLVGAAVLVLSASGALRAEEYVCTGSLGAATVDNLRVPDGARCRLRGTRVQGTITVERDATLKASKVQVIGNVQAENAREVQVARSVVGGSVQLKQGGSARVKTSAVNGDLQLESNARPLKAHRNVIGGNLQAFQNTGGVTITSNEIDGNLQCKENVPAPRGGRNVVHGNAEDQCASLASAEAPAPSGGSVDPPPADPSCQFGAVALGDDFEIPANVSCVMNGTRVAGSVKLNRGSSLDASDVFVDGNIQAQEAFVLRVAVSEVRGSVQFEQGGSASVRDTDVAGNLQLVSNAGALQASDNRIDGDLQAFQNRGGPGIALDRNRIDGNMQCKENSPAPVGAGNIVQGNKEDQCRNL
jgi:hypothetical protein